MVMVALQACIGFKAFNQEKYIQVYVFLLIISLELPSREVRLRSSGSWHSLVVAM